MSDISNVIEKSFKKTNSFINSKISNFQEIQKNHKNEKFNHKIAQKSQKYSKNSKIIEYKYARIIQRN